MTTYGVTDTGFVKKSYANVIESLHANAKRMFGNDVDLTPGSPIKILIDLYALNIVDLWNTAEATYNSAFLETATGYSLDNLGKLVGATRTPATYATGYVTFFRTTVLPDGSPRVINSGIKVSTTDILANEYVTTESVYFQPTITNEEHLVEEDGFNIDTTNLIGTLSSVTDSNGIDYTSSVTFDGRTLTFIEEINADTTIYVTYKPLSVTAPVIATTAGVSSNVAANSITVLETSVDFIHYISNEEGVDTGSDVESDSHFRQSIIGATQAVGKSTETALKYYIGEVTGVKNVIIENPLKITATDTLSGNGTTSVFATHIPLDSVNYVTGSTTGSFTIDTYDSQTGEIQLTALTNASETVSINYNYYVPGKIKIYVEGGTTGDENTEDTVVYAIEHTRAAGIQAVGYDSGDSAAYGSASAKFSWFYRPNDANIDLAITVYFDSSSILTTASKNVILTKIQDNIANYIDELELGSKVYKNKILQIVISADEDIIDAELTSWSLNDDTVAITESYIDTGSLAVPVCNTVSLTQSTA